MSRPLHLLLRPVAAVAMATALFALPQSGLAQKERLPGASTRSVALATPSAPNQFGPRQVWIGQSTSALVSALAVPAESTPGLIPGVGGLVLVLSIVVEETQAEESFTLYVPPTPPGVERPMLVAFHGFNVSHLDIWANTSFIDECQARDWILIAPYQRNLAPTGPGTSQISFGSAESQLHVRAVIQYVLDRFAVDRDRIYGVGFSMGGGAAMSYAARNRDREEGALAAVVNHTGTVALQHVYANADTNTQALMRRIFTAAPQFAPFEYNRASVIEMDANGVLVLGGYHMARNLTDVPVRTYYGIGDGQAYLIDEAQALHSYMSLISTNHELLALPADCPFPAQQGHCWDTIDETEVCDWLGSKSLAGQGQIGQVLADRSGKWGSLDVDPAVSGDFASFDYSISSSQNSIRILGSDNLETLALDLADLGLNRNAAVGLRLGSADGTGDDIVLSGYGAPPSAVMRNGVLVNPDCTLSGAAAWCLDPATGDLRICEPGPQTAIWSVTP